jgi:hypothetical protein
VSRGAQWGAQQLGEAHPGTSQPGEEQAAPLLNDHGKISPNYAPAYKLVSHTKHSNKTRQ